MQEKAEPQQSLLHHSPILHNLAPKGKSRINRPIAVISKPHWGDDGVITG